MSIIVRNKAHVIVGWLTNDDIIEEMRQNHELDKLEEADDKWEQTDDMQFVKQKSEYEFNVWDCNKYGENNEYSSIFFNTIDLRDYTDDELISILNPYSLELPQLIKEKEYQVIAECIAESSDIREETNEHIFIM